MTSQFEQLVRTTCNLPLGDTSLITPCAIVNLLGDVWLDATPNFAGRLRFRACGCICMRSAPRKMGRKMGHLSAIGATADEALERVLEAKKRLGLPAG